MNTRLKCLLLDDELPGLTYLKILCDQIPELEVVKAFISPEKFLAELPALEFDLCIMDIEMPVLNGLQVADLLHGKPVIFTTAYKEYAADAFNLDAIDYVLKPIKKERLQKAVLKAIDSLTVGNYEKKFVQLNTDKGKSLIFFDQLCYVTTSEIDSRDKLARLYDGTNILIKNISFDKLQQILPKNIFCRINKREMISLKTVRVFSYNEISTSIPSNTGGVLKLSLSELYRAEFIAKLSL